MSKHIINSPKTLVSESLAGLAYTNPGVYVQGTSVFLHKTPNRVNLVCGGGSGHEPHTAGFVGEGMLSAAVGGQTFASPNSGQVEQALENLASGKGTLLITKNYTGDVLQFGLARERWAAHHHGENNVRMIAIGDDVAVPRSQGALTGRRGLAGTALVYKIAGALAAKGANLDEVEFIAKMVAESCATVGMGLEHCHVAGTANPEKRYLGADEAELGMGIHNEPGIQKLSPVPTAENLINTMLTMITDTTDKERGFLPLKGDGKDSVILLVNNLGGLPLIELMLIVNEASKWLAKKDITVERVVSGSFISSLNLPGFSLSLVLLPRSSVTPSFDSKTTFDRELLIDCLDAPTEAPSWPWCYKGRPKSHAVDLPKITKTSSSKIKGPAPAEPKVFLAAIQAAVKKVIAAESDITRFDTIAGDGDAGLTLKAGGEGILAKLDSDKIPSDDVALAILSIAEVVEVDMGGTSGGLYAIFMSALAKGLVQAAADEKSEIATAKVWARALELALNTLYIYTRARPPSRTLVDPLAAFIITFGLDPSNFLAAFIAAKEAAEATRTLKATAGRAAYVAQDDLAEANVPDPGAFGILKVLEGIKSVM